MVSSPSGAYLLEMSKASFPHYFPPGCPPSNAGPASGLVFRIVAGGVLTEEDFQSHYEAGTASNAPPCGRCGVSVFNSSERALHRLRLSPHLGKAIARGQLKADGGRTQLTNARSGHVEWWPYAGVTRRSFFKELTPCL